MNDRFIRPQRTAKGQMRTIFYCLCVAIVFTLPFGTGFMASRLGFSLAGRPAFILPKYAVAAMRLLAVVSFAFFWYFLDRKSTRLNSSHVSISYAVFCLKKKIQYRLRSW